MHIKFLGMETECSRQNTYIHHSFVLSQTHKLFKSSLRNLLLQSETEPQNNQNHKTEGPLTFQTVI
jgi:hypothetical protein